MCQFGSTWQTLAPSHLRHMDAALNNQPVPQLTRGHGGSPPTKAGPTRAAPKVRQAPPVKAYPVQPGSASPLGSAPLGDAAAAEQARQVAIRADIAAGIARVAKEEALLRATGETSKAADQVRRLHQQLASQTAAHAQAQQQAAEAIRQTELDFDQAQETYRLYKQARQQAGQREAEATQARERSEAFLARQKAEEARLLRQQQAGRARVDALAVEAHRLKAVADKELAIRRAAEAQRLAQEKAKAELEASQALERQAALIAAKIRLGPTCGGRSPCPAARGPTRLRQSRCDSPGSASPAAGAHSLRHCHLHRRWHSQWPCPSACRLLQ